MILKYQTLDGAWRLIDGVTELINHGYCEDPVIHDLAEKYDGHGVSVGHTGLPVYGKDDSLELDRDEPRVRFYVVVTVRGERQHWAIPDMQQGFLMSDDGKTIDRLLH